MTTEVLVDGGRVVDDLDALYAGSYRRLVVQMYAICGDLNDAEDAVQEAFITAIRKRRTLRTVQNREAWIRTVALHRLHRGGATRPSYAVARSPIGTSSRRWRSGPNTSPWSAL